MEVERLVSIGPRPSGSPGAERAAAHIRQTLEAQGIVASIDTFEEATPVGRIVFRNVSGIIPGTRDGLVVLASHYDTKSGIGDAFVGANDSGSSTGLLLALARFLKQSPRLDTDILLAFFDGEECLRAYGPGDGLHGSRFLANRIVACGRREKIRAVIVLDMIGDRDLKVTLPRNSTPDLANRVFKAAQEEGVRHRFALAPGAIIDDHVPFLAAGIPTVNLIDFEYGSARGKNDYWHTDQDTLDKLSADSLQTVGRVVIRLLDALAGPAREGRPTP